MWPLQMLIQKLFNIIQYVLQLNTSKPEEDWEKEADAPHFFVSLNYLFFSLDYKGISFY